mgnify:CR=1 FL=1
MVDFKHEKNGILILIHMWLTGILVCFLQGRKQKVVADGIVTDYLYNQTRGVPREQYKALYYFIIMVNDIKSSQNLNFLVKFTDDLTSSILVKSGDSNSNSAANEVQSIVA